MGSKAPTARKPPQSEPPEESLLCRSDVVKASAKNQLLGRIAEALQVPPAVLYNPPNAITPVWNAESGGTTGYGHDQNCKALLDAYRRINDPAERQRLLRLVQAASEQG